MARFSLPGVQHFAKAYNDNENLFVQNLVRTASQRAPMASYQKAYGLCYKIYSGRIDRPTALRQCMQGPNINKRINSEVVELMFSDPIIGKRQCVQLKGRKLRLKDNLFIGVRPTFLMEDGENVKLFWSQFWTKFRLSPINIKILSTLLYDTYSPKIFDLNYNLQIFDFHILDLSARDEYSRRKLRILGASSLPLLSDSEYEAVIRKSIRAAEAAQEIFDEKQNQQRFTGL